MSVLLAGTINGEELLECNESSETLWQQQAAGHQEMATPEKV